MRYERKFGVYFRKLWVNTTLADYLAQTQSLEKLDLSCGPWHQHHLRLKDTHMDYLAYGLRFNSSLKSLWLVSQPIGDDGLSLLLEAMKANRALALQELNLAETSITEAGVKKLLAFMTENHSLESVNIHLNHLDQYRDQVNALTKRNLAEKNENSNNTYKEKPAVPSMSPQSQQRFFNSMGERIHVGQYLQAKNWQAWDSLLKETLNPFGTPLFIVVDYDRAHKLSFYMALSHPGKLAYADYVKGAFITSSGTVYAHQKNLDVDVVMGRGVGYLNQDQSVFKMTMKNLRARTPEELDAKLEAGFNEIKSALAYIFTNGIYVENKFVPASFQAEELLDTLKERLNDSQYRVFLNENVAQYPGLSR